MGNNTISLHRLEKYFEVTRKALEKANLAEKDASQLHHAEDFLDMAQRYFDDARHFEQKGDRVTAYSRTQKGGMREIKDMLGI